VYRAQVYRELVYGIYCVHKRARSHWRRVLFFGYYSRFYLITFVPAEIGEICQETGKKIRESKSVQKSAKLVHLTFKVRGLQCGRVESTVGES
jgi:hypothetical protein